MASVLLMASMPLLLVRKGTHWVCRLCRDRFRHPLATGFVWIGFSRLRSYWLLGRLLIDKLRIVSNALLCAGCFDHGAAKAVGCTQRARFTRFQHRLKISGCFT